MEKETYTRRSFMTRAWMVLGAVTFAELVAVLVAYFRPRKILQTGAQQDAIIVAGNIDSFEPGSVSAFVRGKFYLARLDDGGFLALSRRCTHLNCTVPWVADQKRFICPCHSSEFDITGEVVNPPAPHALDLYAVDIRNDVLSVDTSKITRRSSFSADQVKYAKTT